MNYTNKVLIYVKCCTNQTIVSALTLVRKKVQANFVVITLK